MCIFKFEENLSENLFYWTNKGKQNPRFVKIITSWAKIKQNIEMHFKTSSLLPSEYSICW